MDEIWLDAEGKDKVTQEQFLAFWKKWSKKNLDCDYRKDKDNEQANVKRTK